MFNEIRNDPDLWGACRGTCSENNIGVTFDAQLLGKDGEINDERVLILKVDHIYSTAFMDEPPKSVDCLVIVKCIGDEVFDLYLIELRNVKRARYAHPNEITDKYVTVTDDMLQNRYSHIFSKFLPRIRSMRCFLVTDPFRLAGRNLSREEIKAYIGGTVLDAYASLAPIRLGGHIAPIEVVLPDPVIGGC